MTEPRFEITWTSKKTELMTRRDIEAGARVGLASFRAACREWLEANPRGLTREQFEALPDGSVVKPYDIEYVKVGDRLAYTHFNGHSISFADLADADLAGMTVVSTPAPPPLEKVHIVRDCGGAIWERWRYRPGFWSMTNSAVITERDLIENYGPITPLIPGPQIGGSE